MLPSCPQQHPGLRLAAVARGHVCLDNAGRIVRAIVVRVDARAARGEPRRHRRVCLGDERLLDDAPRDPGLVGDHDDGKTGAVERADDVDAIGEEDHSIEAIEIPRFLDDRSVAIQEHGAPHARCPAIEWSTVSASILFMQRWSMGHSRKRHGRQNTSRRIRSTPAATPGPPGDVTRSSVGPKIAVSGTPSAAATCIAPESLDTNAAHRAMTPTSCRSVVRPTRSTNGVPGGSNDSIARAVSRSAAAPTMTAVAPWAASRAITWATRSGGHSLAWP